MKLAAWLLKLGFFLLVLWFALRNTTPVPVRLSSELVWDVPLIVVMLVCVALGALLNIFLLLLFDLRLGIHLLLGGILSFFLATLISLIVLMDHPFRGEMGVSASAFELVYDQLMKP